MAKSFEKPRSAFSFAYPKRDRNTKTNSQIEERSYLIFEFPDGPGDSGENPVKQTLNFAENIEVVETQKAKLNELKPVGRNGGVYVHTGSDSRMFSIKFNMTLQNLIQHHYYTEHRSFKALSKSEIKELYKRSETYAINSAGFEGSRYFTNQRIRTQYYTRPRSALSSSNPEESFVAKVKTLDDKFLNNMDNQELAAFSRNELDELRKGGSEARNAAIGQITFWTNLIRLSVLGNTEYPHLGPPIVRLNHGILYENVRCIAEDYSISLASDSGYDQKTLLPNVIRVQMKLKEVRLSETGFNPNTRPDNLLGWNDIIGNGYTSLNGITR